MILTRRLPPLATVPAITLAARRFGYRFGLAGDHGFVNIRSAFNHGAVRWNTRSRPNQHDVAKAQFSEGDRFRFWPLYAFSGIREKSCKGIEGATGLGNGPHFKPVAEQHDRNQRREFPPNVNLEETECCSERRAKRNCDR